MGLVRTILIILLIYFAVRFIVRLLFPFIARMFIHRVAQKMNQQQQWRNDEQSAGFEQHGDVYIKRSGSKKDKTQTADEGEFIDYKEVD